MTRYSHRDSSFECSRGKSEDQIDSHRRVGGVGRSGAKGRTVLAHMADVTNNREGNARRQREEYDVEEAIDLTGYGKYHRGLMFACGACMKTLIMETMGVNFVLVGAQCDFELTTAEKGYIAGIIFVGMMLAAHAWSFISDKIGRRKVLVISFITTWMSTFIAIFVPNLWSFIAMRFITGLFLSGMSFTSYVYLSEFVTITRYTKYMIWTCGFIVLAFVLVPVTAWLNLQRDIHWNMGYMFFTSWRFYMVFMNIPMLIDVFEFRRWPESPKYLMSIGKKEEALAVLRRMHKRNSGKTPGEYPVNDLRSRVPIIKVEDSDGEVPLEDDEISQSLLAQYFHATWRQIYPLFVFPYIWRTLLFSVIQIGIAASSGGMYLWLPTILNSMASNANETSATICDLASPQRSEAEQNPIATSSVEKKCVNHVHRDVYASMLIIAVGFAFFYPAIVALSKIFGRQKVLVLGLILSGTAGIGSYFAPNVPWLAACMGGHIVLSWTCTTILHESLVNGYPVSLRGMVFLFMIMSGWLGSAVAGFSIGVLMEVNCAATLIGMGCLTVCCGLLCIVIPWATRDVESTRFRMDD